MRMTITIFLYFTLPVPFVTFLASWKKKYLNQNYFFVFRRWCIVRVSTFSISFQVTFFYVLLIYYEMKFSDCLLNIDNINPAFLLDYVSFQWKMRELFTNFKETCNQYIVSFVILQIRYKLKHKIREQVILGFHIARMIQLFCFIIGCIVTY